MRELFKGERQNSEDFNPVSIWTFIDTDLEITLNFYLYILGGLL
jgi:hypothetical protein